MSVLNVLNKHMGGLPHLLLRLVLTVIVRAICAGVSNEGSVQGGIVWIAVCLGSGLCQSVQCLITYAL